jgi:hypothetical protein
MMVFQHKNYNNNMMVFQHKNYNNNNSQKKKKSILSNWRERVVHRGVAIAFEALGLSRVSAALHIIRRFSLN